MQPNLTIARAYIDSQDPADVGWAYRLTLSDGHEESGPLDSALDDASGALSELRALVTAYDGAWGGLDVDVATSEGGECFVWRASRG
jgi:hypothetical protein